MAKTRSGFVSNSSSSSFIVAAKGEIDRDRIIEILGVPETSPLRSFAEEVADVLMTAQEMGFEELADWGDDGTLAKLIKRGFTIYEGSASDEGTEAAEYALCFMTLHHDSPDLVIIKEGGY